jgi:hypothetical protein
VAGFAPAKHGGRHDRNARFTAAVAACAAAVFAAVASGTQEAQNEIGRTVRNWSND